jgi:hypothetical protein
MNVEIDHKHTYKFSMKNCSFVNSFRHGGGAKLTDFIGQI